MCDMSVALWNFSVEPMAIWLLLLLPNASTSQDSEMNFPSSPPTPPLDTPRLKNEVHWLDTAHSYMEVYMYM